MRSAHLPQEEHEVSDGVDCGDAQGVFHQDDEGVTRRSAETGAVDGCGCICILGNTERRQSGGGEEEEEEEQQCALPD